MKTDMVKVLYTKADESFLDCYKNYNKVSAEVDIKNIYFTIYINHCNYTFDKFTDLWSFAHTKLFLQNICKVECYIPLDNILNNIW